MAARRSRLSGHTAPLPFEDRVTCALPDGGSCGVIEDVYAARGEHALIGVDEAGRGPLAGPVVVAAVLLDPRSAARWAGLTDSKLLSESARNDWFARIQQEALAWRIVAVDTETIDQRNILGATLFGMRLAVDGVRTTLSTTENVLVLVDGNRPIPALVGDQRTLVRGDSRSLAIAAASVLAKVTRDREMESLDQQWPGYGFAQHKGYGTPAHLRALATLGPTPVHRRSFAPVRAAAALQTGIVMAGEKEG